MALQYAGGNSTINGASTEQMNSFLWLRKSIIESRKDQYFFPLADVKNMPKHYGKTIKVYEYIPLLDDRNVNDQGIDANGVTIETTTSFVYFPSLTGLPVANADKAALKTAVDKATNGLTATVGANDSAGTGFATVTFSRLDGVYANADVAAVVALKQGAVVQAGSGNLYGSSKDVGNVTGRIPALSENGGRVGRVGFKRVFREGSITEFGMFTEFTRESMEFDSDDQLRDHLARELMNGAVQMQEAQLQIDLLNAAGVVVYSGAATSNATVTGEGANRSLVDYDDFVRLDQILTDNRTPRQSTVITGSNFTDTKTIPACRIMYVGSEVVPHLKKLQDSFGHKAFIAVQHYADAGTTLNGEIGTIDQFRIIQVPEMLHWAGAGAAEASNPGFRASGGRYNVYPMLVVGSESFTALGFQNDGKKLGLNVMTRNYGQSAMSESDPYGKKGISSMSWYYGMLVYRPERIGMIKTIAPI